MRSNKEQMQCMEILGSNLATNVAYEAPGLDIYVDSAPHDASETGGGDVYYITNCASGRVTRLLLADVCGHGKSVAGLADSLKNSLQQNVNTISQSRFVRHMNQEFQKLPSNEGQMATAVVATYFESQKRLSLGLAGHPNPLLYLAEEGRWHKIDEEPVPDREENDYSNMPLGIVDDSVYPTRNLRIQPNDMLLLYSDAFIESFNSESRLLGIDGMLDLMNQIDVTDPEEIIPQLQTSLRSFSSSNLDHDDATVILVRFTDRKPRWRNTLTAPFRMLKRARDRTTVEF